MPLIVEPLAFRWNDPESKSAFTMETSLAVTRPLVR